MEVLVIGVLIGTALILGLRLYVNHKGNKIVERFLLPEGSDKEFFMDGKRKYDKEAYMEYQMRTVRKMTDPQLKKMYEVRAHYHDIWNELLCEAMKNVMVERGMMDENGQYIQTEDSIATLQDEELDEAIEEINDDIAPFFWVDQASGASIGLTTGSYLQDLFEANGMKGTGFDWDRVADAFLKDNEELRGEIEFESQMDTFSAYGKDAETVKKFAYDFRAACTKRAEAEALFAAAAAK